MNAAAAFAAGGLAIALLCVALAVAIVLRRGLRQRSVRRRIALADPYRPLLVALVADEGQDPVYVERLLALDDRVWRALEPVVVSMVRKLRGGARTALVELLERRGTIDRLVKRLHGAGAVGRARSAELLGLLGAHAPREELEHLLEHDRDPEVRIVAARALGEIGDPASTKILVRCVAGTHPVPMRIVARSLARLGPGATPVLVTAMSAQDPAARAVAAEILGLGGAVTAVGVLASHAAARPGRRRADPLRPRTRPHRRPQRSDRARPLPGPGGAVRAAGRRGPRDRRHRGSAGRRAARAVAAGRRPPGRQQRRPGPGPAR